MADNIALSIKNLSKDFNLPHERKSSLKEWVLHFRKPTYEKLHALHDINVDVKKGEFFGIVGRNGSGKSTLLKIIGGIYQPTKGSVTVNGTLTPFIELGIGFNPELTGRENVFMNGAILGISRKEMKTKYNEIVEFAELDKFMDQKLKNYSSGMQVRLAFSIAIQAHNDILLIDEVLAVGDAAFQRKCFRVFKEIKKSGKTVIFVTHDMGAVQEYCDRAMMIQDSEVIDIGEPRKIALRYAMANASKATTSGKNSQLLQRPINPAVKIMSLKVKNNGKVSDKFTIDDDIEAEITLKVTESIEIQANFFFLQANSSYLAGINSNNDLGFNFKPKKGTQRFKCVIKAGQLVRGEYGVGVGIYTPGFTPEIIDVIDNNYSSEMPIISILNQSNYKDGLFYINGKWSKIDQN